MPRGLLEVHVMSAQDINDKQWIGKQDPYCKLQLGNQSYRTTTATDGGTKPVWNQRFQFQVGEQHRELVAALWNSNTMAQNDCLGSVRIPLAKCFAHGHDNSPQPIISPKGRSAGELRLMMIFTSDGTARPAAAPAAAAPAPVAPAPMPQPVQQRVVQQPQMVQQRVVQQPQMVQQPVYRQPAPQVVQQPQVVYQQAPRVVQQPQVVYAQPQPQVVYAQPQVMQQPRVVYAQPAAVYPSAPSYTYY